MLARELPPLFAPGGVLAQAIPGYRFRPQQLEMAERVAEAIEAARPLVVEAGTGTGKTFAYLVPALLAGGKTIISTGTKTLQDQLFHRDLPRVRDALRVPLTVALLKGRANYVCLHHLERTADEGRLVTRSDVTWLHRILEFSRISTTGDRGDLADVPENAAIWPLVTSTRENCLGGECPRFRDCFVMGARKEALAADVVVVNHHLFFADIALKDEGMAELLPACNTVILDEAHQLPDTATTFFGEQVTAGQLADLARDTDAAARRDAREVTELGEAAVDLATAAKRFRLAIGRDTGKWPRAELERAGAFRDALADLAAAIRRLAEELSLQRDRTEDLGTCAERIADIEARLGRWTIAETSGSGWVHWVDVTPHGWQLHASPLSVADVFSRQVLDSARSWIFTSATLSVNGNFAHYLAELGLADVEARSWPSPFDYASQSLLYVPARMPVPNSSEHTDAVVDAALPVLEASRGRAFLLFTSLRALERAHERVVASLAARGLAFPVLVQGQGSKTELLERFRATPNAVLIGSQSFWEGVDVPGDALSVVVIDKLPFAPPDDPVIAARLEHFNAQGRNAFMDYQLPQAVISLKQGAGRLIRSETDRGVLMIGDARLVEKPYGRRIWQSLPPMRRTRNIDDVIAFFSSSVAAVTSG